ncbi:MAG: DNA-binding protein, partial [Lysobacter sp.]|nr:DNA-binding protein [Lysobacter sp.]
MAKLYHPGIDHATYERKVAAMLRLSPDLPDLVDGASRKVQIAWPTSLLRDRHGRFVGFLMPAVDVQATSELELILQEKQARAAQLPTGLGPKVTLAANLAAVVAALHARHHYIVDLKPVNLRFYRQSLHMAMLDCDGFSIQGVGERFPAPQFTPDYLAPEFQRDGITAEGEQAQDRFALAVVVFQLLNFGIHPFTGRPIAASVPTDIPSRIAGRWYAYGVRANTNIAPNPGSGHARMPAELRTMFDRAFESRGFGRPAAHEWQAMLESFALRSTGRMVVCSRDAVHQHYAGMDCAHCDRVQLLRKARAAQPARSTTTTTAHTRRPTARTTTRPTARPRAQYQPRTHAPIPTPNWPPGHVPAPRAPRPPTWGPSPPNTLFGWFVKACE